MFIEISINPIAPSCHLLNGLAVEARQQRYQFMDRLLDEARSQTNVFQKEGECFCGAFADGLLVGCGGVNQDPYLDRKVGRLRHVYVLQAYRRSGIAATLVRDLLRRSESAFKIIRLRTSDESASKFYDTLGFMRTNHETATHVLEI